MSPDPTSTLDGARAYAAHHADVDDRTPSAGDLAEDAYFDDLARRHLDAAIGQHFASMYVAQHKGDPVTPPTFDDDVLRLIDLQATIKQLEDELDTIKSRIRAHGPGRVGQLQVRLIPQRRFSPVVAATVLSPEQIAAIAETTTVLSGSRAKQALPPDIYARCLYDIGEPRVTVA